MSYHLESIPKGTLGYKSKITEEYLEFLDAEKQENRIMVLLELSDLVGAISFYLDKNFPGFSLKDLDRMHRTTKRAFDSGARK